MNTHENKLVDDALAYITEVNKSCRIQGNEVVFGHDEGFYAIRLAECSTHESILFWVLHLSEKIWVTPGILARFAELAASHHGLSIGLGNLKK